MEPVDFRLEKFDRELLDETDSRPSHALRPNWDRAGLARDFGLLIAMLPAHTALPGEANHPEGAFAR